MRFFECLLISCLGIGVMGNTLASALCNATIHADDRIRWDTPEIKIDKTTCQVFSITLIHDGHLDKSVMGHDLVLTKESDKDELVKELIFKKEDDYLSDDPRIIAHTKLIGGGQMATVELDVSKLQEGETYSYFCSYPEHAGLMMGKLTVIGE